MADRPPPPGRPPAPPRPASPGTRPPAPGPAPEEDAQLVRELSGRLGGRILPKVRAPKFVRRRLPELPDPVARRARMLAGWGQAAFLVAGMFIGGALIISRLLDATISEPSSAREVLDLIPRQGPQASWSAETVRTKAIDGSELRQDTIAGFETDTKTGKFQVQASGVKDKPLRLQGDGHIALSQDGSDPAGVYGCSGKVCSQLPVQGRAVPYPAYQTLAPLSAADVRRSAGRLASSKATVAGGRGWLITWHPSRRDILTMLGASILGLRGPDIAAIKAGRYAVQSAVATVTRSDPRLFQAQASITVNGADLDILNTFRGDHARSLDGLVLDPNAAGDGEQ